MFIGNIEYEDPAMTNGVGVGQAFKTLLGITVLTGASGGLDTYAQQAAGKGDYQLSGTYLNRARLIAFLTFIPVALVQMNFSYPLRWCKMNEDVVNHAQTYMSWTVIECFFYAQYYCQRIYLQSWKHNYSVLIAQVLSTFIFPFWCWLFMVHWRL